MPGFQGQASFPWQVSQTGDRKIAIGQCLLQQMVMAIPAHTIEQYTSNLNITAMGGKAAQRRNSRRRLPSDINDQDNWPTGFCSDIRRRA
jgi:hypothetical protein